ncbi:hypothetical protein J7J83_02805 [bacterium]|nr:hypothetical protein [bacterium]
MKIAIASETEDVNGQVSDRAGRATYYLIFDENKKLIDTVKNPFSVGGGGAGFSVAKMLADMNADIVIAPKFGGNMAGALDDRNVKHKEFEGSIQDALSSSLQ